MRICESVTVSNKDITLNGVPFGHVGWLGDSDLPIFYWYDNKYYQHTKVITTAKELRPKFRPQLLQNGDPGLEIKGRNYVTQELCNFICTLEACRNIANLDIVSPGERMLIRFNKDPDAEDILEYIKYINDNFRYSIEDEGIEIESEIQKKPIEKVLTLQEKISRGPVYFTCPLCGGNDFSTVQSGINGARDGSCQTITNHQFCDYTWERNKENDDKLFTRLTRDEWMALYDEAFKEY